MVTATGEGIGHACHRFPGRDGARRRCRGRRRRSRGERVRAVTQRCRRLRARRAAGGGRIGGERVATADAVSKADAGSRAADPTTKAATHCKRGDKQLVVERYLAQIKYKIDDRSLKIFKRRPGS
jgi:hypothetical protein